jgi:catechol 2,3-dioxygenase-like lactoylglutathione lyase family enzyme
MPDTRVPALERRQTVLGNHPIRATIPARDMARARAFYADTLGLKVVEENPEGVEFESGGVRFGIYPTRATAGSGATVATWEVPDLETEMTELRNRGVQFDEYDLPNFKTVNGIAEIEGYRGAWFKDPEGNVLSVVQRTT